MNNDTLLSCPFCGGIARLEKEARFPYAVKDDPDYFAHFAVCNSCAAQGGWAKTPGNAIRNWNMRTPQAEAQPALLQV